MEIPDIIIAITILYISVTTVLLIGAFSKFELKKTFASMSSIQLARWKYLRTIRDGLSLGLMTGAVVAVYYNWVACLREECPVISGLNVYNLWFEPMVEIVGAIILIIIIVLVFMWILEHRKIE
jgi:hypothetical protein